MNIFELKSHIINNPEYIEEILEKVGFYNIDNRGKEYRCAREPGRNPTSVKINKSTLGSTCYSTNVKGDIITLVQSKLNTSFPDAVRKVSNIVNFKFDNKIETAKLPFGGYYKKISKLRSEEDVELETYSDDVLLQYESLPNLLFYEDGILPQVQTKFNIGYDSFTGRITVPWTTSDGRVCGVMGRLNKKEIEEDEVKWFPVISFPKSKTIYGYVTNYSAIQEKKIVMLGESEKHTMALASKGLNVGLSLGGSFLSENQSNLVKSLFPEKIIIMLDEGLTEEHSIELAKQLKSDRFYKNEVGYVFDRNNIWLPKDSKMAPADLHKDDLNKLLKNCTHWV